MTSSLTRIGVQQPVGVDVAHVVDDEDRENEGDFICAAECITPEIINFMSKNGRGLICAPIIEERCDELGLELMVGKNTALHETPFTVSVDLLGHGCTTGISASDRSKTVKALVEDWTKPEDLGRPGHIFPLKAKKGGVLSPFTGGQLSSQEFETQAFALEKPGDISKPFKTAELIARVKSLQSIGLLF